MPIVHLQRLLTIMCSTDDAQIDSLLETGPQATLTRSQCRTNPNLDSAVAEPAQLATTLDPVTPELLHALQSIAAKIGSMYSSLPDTSPCRGLRLVRIPFDKAAHQHKMDRHHVLDCPYCEHQTTQVWLPWSSARQSDVTLSFTLSMSV